MNIDHDVRTSATLNEATERFNSSIQHDYTVYHDELLSKQATSLGETRDINSTVPSSQNIPSGETESQAAPVDQDSVQSDVKAEHGATAVSPAKARKPKKVRTLTRQRIDEIAAEMAKHAVEGHFADNLIPVSLVAEHFNITVALVERIFIQAFSEHGLAGYKLDYGTDGTGKGADECYIDDRGMILIGKSIIESFNSKPDLGCKFEKGDRFTVTCSENEIVLTIKQ